MRVAVLGSWRESKNDTRKTYWGLRDLDRFAEACADIGEQLARKGRSINVCDDAKDSAEFHVVRGFLKVPASDRALVHVMPNTKTERRSFEDLARLHDGSFVTEPTASKDIPDARIVAMRTADAVVLIAGTESTYESGLIAMITRKRLIPLGSFGGAGERIIQQIGQWRALGLHLPNSVPDGGELSQLAGVWGPSKLKTIERSLDARTSMKLMIICGRSMDWQSLKNHLHDRLKLPEPIVMRETFGTGRALADRFDQLAGSVHGAIALITPDDVGGPTLTEQGKPMEGTSAQNRRARQNLWLEIGWFWGALGRRRILFLTRDKVEFPSDLDGIEFVSYQDDPGRECTLEIEKFVESLADY